MAGVREGGTSPNSHLQHKLAANSFFLWFRVDRVCMCLCVFFGGGLARVFSVCVCVYDEMLMCAYSIVCVCECLLVCVPEMLAIWAVVAVKLLSAVEK